MSEIRAQKWLSSSLRRYLPAEAAGVAASLAAGLLFVALTGSAAVAALAATWGENAGYYGVIAIRDLLERRRRRDRRPLLTTLGSMLLEFAPAEALDSFLFRPALMFAGLQLAPNPLLGIVAGKLAADLLFYVVTISSRQLLGRRRQLPTGGLP